MDDDRAGAGIMPIQHMCPARRGIGINPARLLVLTAAIAARTRLGRAPNHQITTAARTRLTKPGQVMTTQPGTLMRLRPPHTSFPLDGLGRVVVTYSKVRAGAADDMDPRRKRGRRRG
jgi:hypothetical protein